MPVKVRLLVSILLLTLAAGLLGGCGLFTKEPAAVSPITLTDQVDEKTKEARRPLTGYPATTTEFFAVVKVMNPRQGTKVAARWYYDGKFVQEFPLDFAESGKDRFVAFNLVSSSNQPFPTGQYKVEILLDGNVVQQQEFKVE